VPAPRSSWSWLAFPRAPLHAPSTALLSLREPLDDLAEIGGAPEPLPLPGPDTLDDAGQAAGVGRRDPDDEGEWPDPRKLPAHGPHSRRAASTSRQQARKVASWQVGGDAMARRIMASGRGGVIQRPGGRGVSQRDPGFRQVTPSYGNAIVLYMISTSYAFPMTTL